MSFCKAEDPSQTKELQHAQQAKLTSAKAKAQQIQKEQYDKRSHKPGMYVMYFTRTCNL